MRIKENISFKRGRDVKSNLGLGASRLKNAENFSSAEEFVDLLIKVLPSILNTYGIPPDILGGPWISAIGWPYYYKIFEFIGEDTNNNNLLDEWPQILNDKLSERGFKKIAQYQRGIKHSPYFIEAEDVSESASFQRGKNPRDTLGIGINLYRDPNSFRDTEEFIEWLYRITPSILHTKGIPPDILGTESGHLDSTGIISWPYYYKIQKFLLDRGFMIYEEDLISKWFYHLRDLLSNKYGFKRIGKYREFDKVSPYFLDNDHEISESLSFERGRDSKRTLGLGAIPQNKDIYVPYLINMLPSILGTKEIPHDILMSDGGFYINEIYDVPLDEFLLKSLNTNSTQNISAKNFSTRDIVDQFGYNIWHELRDALVKMGYKQKQH